LQPNTERLPTRLHAVADRSKRRRGNDQYLAYVALMLDAAYDRLNPKERDALVVLSYNNFKTPFFVHL
jgi:hypothetical protein